MYRVGENPIKRRHHRMELYTAIIIFVAGGIFFGKHLVQSDTKISPAPRAVHKTVSVAQPTKTFDEGAFSINLPSDWKLVMHYTDGANRYAFQSSDTKIAGRMLDVYLDDLPTSLGINRALSVQANGNRVTPVGDVSDNCTTFTTPTVGAQADATPAKWNDVLFLCDLANYERDIVGTVSTDGINKVTLTGADGRHNMFFAYTDNNINPDFTIFLSALQSFRLK